jgi:polar amino acid transport system substrate-binding protein
MRTAFVPPRRLALQTLLLAGVLLAGCATPGVAPEVRQALAPTGTLRVAVYEGSPTSLVRGPAAGEMRGLSVDIGREMARRLGVPAEIVVYERVPAIVAALKDGKADCTITNATAARARDVDFTPATRMLAEGELDAFATNKGILFEMADKLPGSRVLEGRWGLESLAIAVPKGRDAGAAWLKAFAADVAAQGQVQQAATRAGLRGTVAPPRP